MSNDGPFRVLPSQTMAAYPLQNTEGVSSRLGLESHSSTSRFSGHHNPEWVFVKQTVDFTATVSYSVGLGCFRYQTWGISK